MITSHEALMIIVNNSPSAAYELLLNSFGDRDHLRNGYAYLGDNKTIKLLSIMIEDGYIIP